MFQHDLFQPEPSNDAELDLVHAQIISMDPSGERFAAALRRTLDMLLDGQRTGRFRWEQLHKTEKTHAGTLVEINLQREFGFEGGAERMDYRIAGVDVDCKYSQDFGKWMIPQEAMGHLCLGVWASDQEGLWSAGLFRVTEEALTKKDGNRDGKRNLKASARDSIVRWLFKDAPLPENVLLRLPQQDLDAIFEQDSGAKKLDELFRRVAAGRGKPGRRVSRSVVATVAMQEDYMKRVRYNGGSRSRLQGEGIVILGQYWNHQAVAQRLGLPVPGAGESVAVHLARRAPWHGEAPSVELKGQEWVIAVEDDPKGVEAPLLPEKKGRKPKQ